MEDIKVTLDDGNIMYGKLKIGTTTTGNPGEKASVENVGEDYNAVLNFTIPKGDKGDTGAKGEKGESGGAIIYNSLAEMKANSGLVEGDTCQTLGFYAANDGGGATYKIVANATADEYFIHTLSNGLFAELIIENNTVNVKQIGARPQKTNGTKYDIAAYITAYITYLDTLANRVKLYIPSGIWHCSGVTIARFRGFDIYGDEGFCIDKVDGTIITSLNDNQEYILQVGNTEHYTKNWSLRNIVISSADFVYSEADNSFSYGTVKKITGQCVKFIYALYGFTDKLLFLFIDGRAFSMSSSWEIYNGLFNFRSISSHDKSIFCFAEADNTLISGANITACTFDKIMFEATHGDLIECEARSYLGNCHFGVINVEDYVLYRNDVTYTTIDDSILETFDDEAAIHNAIFKLPSGAINGCVIDSIELNNYSYRYHTYNGNTYVYDTIFSCEGDYFNLNCVVNNITINGMNKNCRIIKMPNGIKQYPAGKFILNNVLNNTTKDFYFDVYRFFSIVCNSNLLGIGKRNYKLGREFTPLYEVINHESGAMYGDLYYDEASKNNMKLCVALSKESSKYDCSLISGGSTLLLNAKVPSGETASVQLFNVTTSKYQTLTLEGTGEFKDYSFDVSSNFPLGSEMNVHFASANTASECLLDYYKFIN